MNPKQLKENIIVPVINYLNLINGYNLVLGTCAKESECGYYLRQLKNGPAFGIFQIEELTHNDIRQRFLLLPENESLNKLVTSLLSSKDLYSNGESALISNLEYATAICRIRYLMAPGKLPDENDIIGMAKYWKLYYNTPAGAGKESEFIINYHRYIEGKI